MIISNKHGIYKLSHEFPNNLRLRDLRELGYIEKIANLHRFIA